MICVSIGRTRHKMALAEHRALADRGAQLVELRVDWLSRTPDITRLLAARPTAWWRYRAQITARHPASLQF